MEKQIKNWVNQYIAPLKLEEIRNISFTKDGKKLISQYDIMSKLKDETSTTYQRIAKDVEFYESIQTTENICNYFILSVIKEWISGFTNQLIKNAPFLFEVEKSIPSDLFDENIKSIILSIPDTEYKSVNEMIDDITLSASEDLCSSCFDEFSYKTDQCLDAISYNNLITALYELNDPNINTSFIADELDEYVDEIWLDYFYVTITDIETNPIYLNICPLQTGNDAGTALGKYLDYLNTQLDENYIPYYVHNNTPPVPTALRWLIKSQGYEIKDLFDERKVNNSEFLFSLIYEFQNEQNSCQFLTFMIETDINGLCQMQNNDVFKISKNTVCGFVNFIHGSACGLDIKLEKDINLQFNLKDDQVFQFEGNKDSLSYGRLLSAIQGFSHNSYTKIVF